MVGMAFTVTETATFWVVPPAVATVTFPDPDVALDFDLTQTVVAETVVLPKE